ncbi:MAG: transglutaminase domain-containing protein [Clostridia bacterium]|nr:transglutaminase domain-containing protein [Oscillospiraceae bacterium]MBQ9733132.1 transglutaminase domain-containing protein [Clostridia bacterium]
MKRVSRVLGVFLCLVILLSTGTFAAGGKTIDTSTASEGFFTVEYAASESLKMKVGITFKGETTYHNYYPNTECTYTFDEGNGSYLIELYRNVYGTKYKRVTSTRVNVKIEDKMAPYCASTSEINFAENPAVVAKAAELCEGLDTVDEKIIAMHNYMAKNFRYDYKFAAAVRSGAVTNYTPDTAVTLTTKRGVCYDFSALFAAMCRSQGIPCAMAKGYSGDYYHAWNMVWVDGEWIAVDMTNSVARRNFRADELSECTVSLDNYHDYTY